MLHCLLSAMAKHSHSGAWSGSSSSAKRRKTIDHKWRLTFQWMLVVDVGQGMEANFPWMLVVDVGQGMEANFPWMLVVDVGQGMEANFPWMLVVDVGQRMEANFPWMLVVDVWQGIMCSLCRSQCPRLVAFRKSCLDLACTRLMKPSLVRHSQRELQITARKMEANICSSRRGSGIAMTFHHNYGHGQSATHTSSLSSAIAVSVNHTHQLSIISHCCVSQPHTPALYHQPLLCQSTTHTSSLSSAIAVSVNHTHQLSIISHC